MCFNKEWSLLFLCLSLTLSFWIFFGKGIWSSLEKWKRLRISTFFIYFGLMEMLQFCQYFVINQCSNPLNHFLTIIAWLHISFQPLISNLSFSALDFKNSNKERENLWKFVFILSIFSGVLLFSRIICPLFNDHQMGNTLFEPCTRKMEIICGDKSCTEMGKYHLKWVFHLSRPNYIFPTSSLHFFMSFMIPLILGQHIGTIMLFLSGPFVIGLFLKGDEAEFASIWCFFSIIDGILTIGTQYWAFKRSIKKTKIE